MRLRALQTLLRLQGNIKHKWVDLVIMCRIDWHCVLPIGKLTRAALISKATIIHKVSPELRAITMDTITIIIQFALLSVSFGNHVSKNVLSLVSVPDPLTLTRAIALHVLPLRMYAHDTVRYG